MRTRRYFLPPMERLSSAQKMRSPPAFIFLSIAPQSARFYWDNIEIYRPYYERKLIAKNV